MSILSPRKGLEIPGGGRGLRGKKTLRKCMKLNWNFEGWEVLGKIPSVGEVWIIYGTTHSFKQIIPRCLV